MEISSDKLLQFLGEEYARRRALEEEVARLNGWVEELMRRSNEETDEDSDDANS